VKAKRQALKSLPFFVTLAEEEEEENVSRETFSLIG
jgi:hypothetical protein